ncbi:MAG: hypothetical protein U0414_08855 [Polyangiaceae bacterium]
MRADLGIARVLARRASGDEAGARAVLGAERARLEAIAAQIDDPRLRARFLESPDSAWLLSASA